MADEEKSLKELQAENLRIQNEHLKEQTEFYRAQNEEAVRKRLSRVGQHAEQERTLAEGRAMRDRVQGQCTHLKGGKGDDLANNNGDGDKGGHSVIKHLAEWGERMVKCTRCFAEWWPGDTEENHPTGISYATALRFNTDNSPSGAAQFKIDPAIIEKLRADRLAQRGWAPDGKTRLKSAAA